MEIQLTHDQQHAFERIKLFFSDDENPAIVIHGSAGVRKNLFDETYSELYSKKEV